MNSILVDSNILVYAFDPRDQFRQKTAIQVVGSLVKTGIGRLSAQCLSEFYSATTRQKGTNGIPILSTADAVEQTENLANAFVVFPVTQQIVLEALRGVRQYRLHFWDAQIWASARLNQIPIIFSEDGHAGVVLESVRFVNPFTPDFVLEDWLN